MNCTVTINGTGAFNPAVNWSASAGTITTGGVFTAPSSAGAVKITATSVQDSTESGTTTITVNAPTTITNVTLSCPAGVPISSMITCSASVHGTGSFSGAVTWSTSGGTVSATGVLTAPTSASTVVVTATSVQDPTKTGSASVTVTAAPPPPQTSTNLGSGTNPILQVDSTGNIDVAFLQAASPGGVILARSSDGGSTFTQTTVEQGDSPQYLQMALDGIGNITLLWYVLTPDQHISAFLSRSVDGGASWFPQSTSLTGITSINTDLDPQLAVDSLGNIYIAWSDPNDLFFIRSIDGGVTFSSPVTLADGNAGGPPNVSMQIGEANELYIFSGCFEFIHSIDFGATSLGPRSIDASTISGTCRKGTPFGVVDSSANIDVFLNTPSPVLIKSDDEGASFSGPINTPIAASPQTVAVQVSNDVIYLVGIANPGMLFSHSVQGAGGVDDQSFTAPSTVATGTQFAYAAASVDSCGLVTVAWSENDQTGIFVTQTSDAGATFSAPVNLTGTQPGGLIQLAVDASGNTYALWNDRNSFPNVLFEKVGTSTCGH